MRLSSAGIITPIGHLWIETGLEGIRRVGFAEPAQISASVPYPPLLQQAVDEIQAYFGAGLRQFSLPLELSGLSDFQRAVLLAASAIPFGETQSYAQLAASIGKPGAVRAVGSSLARNPFLLLIPCHRVLGSDGKLHGFAAPDGVRSKLWLLRHEGHGFDEHLTLIQ